MKKLLLLKCLFMLSLVSNGQYITAIGGRAGIFPSGISIKHFLNRDQSIGLDMLGAITREAHSGYLLRVLAVKHISRHDSKTQIPIDYVIGMGGHAGYYLDRYYKLEGKDPVYYPDKTFSLGVDVSLGLEWDSRKTPITIGIECSPFLTLFNPGPSWMDVGVMLRYKLD